MADLTMILQKLLVAQRDLGEMREKADQAQALLIRFPQVTAEIEALEARRDVAAKDNSDLEIRRAEQGRLAGEVGTIKAH